MAAMTPLLLEMLHTALRFTQAYFWREHVLELEKECKQTIHTDELSAEQLPVEEVRSVCFQILDPVEQCEGEETYVTPTPSEPCHFDRLPVEMVENILCRLDIIDCRSSRLVCSQWYSILHRKVCLHFTLSRRSLPVFRKTEFMIDKLTVGIHEVLLHPFPLFEESLELLEGVSTLIFEGSPGERLLDNNKMKFKSIRKDTVNIGDGVKAFVSACLNVRFLKFDFTTIFGQIKLWCPLDSGRFRLTLNNLHTLQLIITCFNDCLMLSSVFRLLETPSLRVLEIERKFPRFRPLTTFDDQAYIDLFEFIARNRFTLKVLKLLNIVPNFKDRPYASQTLFDKLGKLKLLQLDIRYLESLAPNYSCFPDVMTDWTLIDTLLHAQTSLCSLSIQTDSMELIEKTYNVLKNNSSQLRKLNFKLCGRLDYDVVLDCSNLRCLKVLDELSLEADNGILNTWLLPASLRTLYWNVPLTYFPISLSQGNESSSTTIPDCIRNLRKLVLGSGCQQGMDLESVSTKLFSDLPVLEQLIIAKSMLCDFVRSLMDQARNQRQLY